MIVEVSPVATVVLDGSGNGRVQIGPPSGTKWSLRLATGSVSSAASKPAFALYRGSTTGPLELLDSMPFLASQASSGKVGGAVYFPGQVLWGVWSGGDPGATATLQAFGQQGARSDPLPAEPLGEGFPLVTTSLTIPTGATTGPRIVIGADIPAPLATIGTYTTVAVVLWVLSSTQFHFYALGQLANTAAVFRGSYDTTNGVRVFEQWYVNPAANPAIVLGDVNVTPTVAASTVLQVLGGTLLIGSASGNPPNLSPFLIDGTSAPRGRRDYVNDGSATIVSITTNAETAVKASSLINFRNGRAYRLTWRLHVSSTLAQNDILLRLRENGGAQLLYNGGVQPALDATNEHEITGWCVVTNVSGADIQATWNLSLQCPGATVANPVVAGTASVGGHLEMLTEDIGAAGDYPGARNVV